MWECWGGIKCSNANKNASRDRVLRADTMGHFAAVHLHYSVQPGTLCEEGYTRDLKDTWLLFLLMMAEHIILENVHLIYPCLCALHFKMFFFQKGFLC